MVVAATSTVEDFQAVGMEVLEDLSPLIGNSLIDCSCLTKASRAEKNGSSTDWYCGGVPGMRKMSSWALGNSSLVFERMSKGCDVRTCTRVMQVILFIAQPAAA